MVLNALHGDPLPVYGDGQQVRNWIYVEDFARGIGHVLEHGAPGEAYNVGGPDEAVNLDVVKRIIALTGASEDADRVRHRSPRPRPPLLARLREGARAGLGGAGAVRRGARAHGRLVPRQPAVVGADPLGRLPRLLRAPVRHARWATLAVSPELARQSRLRARTRTSRTGRRRPSRPLTCAVAVSPLTVTFSTSGRSRRRP